MSADPINPDGDPRHRLRRQMAVQRDQVSRQLARASTPDQFPRSITMRLLTRQPALASKLALLLAARLGGGKRLAMGLGAAGIAAWLVRSAVHRLARNAEPDDPPHD